MKTQNRYFAIVFFIVGILLLFGSPLSAQGSLNISLKVSNLEYCEKYINKKTNSFAKIQAIDLHNERKMLSEDPNHFSRILDQKLLSYNKSISGNYQSYICLSLNILFESIKKIESNNNQNTNVKFPIYVFTALKRLRIISKSDDGADPMISALSNSMPILDNFSLTLNQTKEVYFRSISPKNDTFILLEYFGERDTIKNSFGKKTLGRHNSDSISFQEKKIEIGGPYKTSNGDFIFFKPNLTLKSEDSRHAPIYLKLINDNLRTRKEVNEANEIQNILQLARSWEIRFLDSKNRDFTSPPNLSAMLQHYRSQDCENTNDARPKICSVIEYAVKIIINKDGVCPASGGTESYIPKGSRIYLLSDSNPITLGRKIYVNQLSNNNWLTGDYDSFEMTCLGQKIKGRVRKNKIYKVLTQTPTHNATNPVHYPEGFNATHCAYNNDGDVKVRDITGPHNQIGSIASGTPVKRIDGETYSFQYKQNNVERKGKGTAAVLSKNEVNFNEEARNNSTQTGEENLKVVIYHNFFREINSRECQN